MSREAEIIADEWVAARDEIRRLRTVNAELEGVLERGRAYLDRLQVENAALLEALELMVLRVPSVLSWCDGGSSPYATDDIGDCHDAVEVGRAAIALAKVKP